MAMSLMDMELIPDMDEKILAEEYDSEETLVLQIWRHSELLQPIMSMLRQQITGEGGSGLYFVNTMGRQICLVRERKY